MDGHHAPDSHLLPLTSYCGITEINMGINEISCSCAQRRECILIVAKKSDFAGPLLDFKLFVEVD